MAAEIGDAANLEDLSGFNCRLSGNVLRCQRFMRVLEIDLTSRFLWFLCSEIVSVFHQLPLNVLLLVVLHISTVCDAFHGIEMANFPMRSRRKD